MNDRRTRVDDAIDRAVREIVQHDPRPGLRRRVLGRLDAPVRRAAVMARLAFAGGVIVLIVMTTVVLRDSRRLESPPPPIATTAPAPPPSNQTAPVRTAKPAPVTPRSRIAAAAPRSIPPTAEQPVRRSIGVQQGRVIATSLPDDLPAPRVTPAAVFVPTETDVTAAPVEWPAPVPITVRPIEVPPIAIVPLRIAPLAPPRQP